MREVELKIKVQVSDWARWVAVDDDGDTWQFEKKPNIERGVWYADTGMGEKISGAETLAEVPPEPIDWTRYYGKMIAVGVEGYHRRLIVYHGWRWYCEGDIATDRLIEWTTARPLTPEEEAKESV